MPAQRVKMYYQYLITVSNWVNLAYPLLELSAVKLSDYSRLLYTSGLCISGHTAIMQHLKYFIGNQRHTLQIIILIYKVVQYSICNKNVLQRQAASIFYGNFRSASLPKQGERAAEQHTQAYAHSLHENAHLHTQPLKKIPKI